jgi:hypothetical protein
MSGPPRPSGGLNRLFDTRDVRHSKTTVTCDYFERNSFVCATLPVNIFVCPNLRTIVL